jgi:steroid Delta-isomerase
METTQTTHHRKVRIPNRVPLPKISRDLNNLLEWLAHPTTRNVKNVPQHYTRDAFFKDPFTEIYTSAEIQRYYEHTLAKLSDMRFAFENISEDGHQAFVTWVMTARFMGREFMIEGASHFKFDSSGLCEYHRDYFDLSEEIYEQLPLLGYVFRGLKRVLN